MTTPWTRSSYCSIGGCIEARRLDTGAVELRSNIGQPMVVTSREWETFLVGVKAGEFDHLEES